jgi:signal transduction histidine kinase
MTRSWEHGRFSLMRWLPAVRRLLERHPFASDAAVAVALAALVESDILTSLDYFTGSKAVYLSAASLMTVPLAWRRRAPLPVLVVVMAALVFEAIGVGSAPTPDTPLIAWLLAIYTVAAHCERTAALIGGAVSLAAGTVWIGFDDVFFPVVVFGGAWLAGRLVRQRHVHAVALEERAAALERAREADARAAAAYERARIAREVHDILAHSLSLIVVQAGAERMSLGSNRAATTETLEAIEQTGRQALAETRQLLGILRADDEALLRRPQPTLAELETLISQVRDSGLQVDLRVEGEPVSLTQGVAVSAYRIVQEALTNVIKHAGPARAHVIVRYGSHELELEVADDGRGPHEVRGNGHGLVGMRERGGCTAGTSSGVQAREAASSCVRGFRSCWRRREPADSRRRRPGARSGGVSQDPRG